MNTLASHILNRTEHSRDSYLYTSLRLALIFHQSTLTTKVRSNPAFTCLDHAANVSNSEADPIAVLRFAKWYVHTSPAATTNGAIVIAISCP